MIVQRISASFCCNCAKNGEGAKFGTNEAGTIQIKNRLEGSSKVSNIYLKFNMAISQEGMHLTIEQRPQKRHFCSSF